ncbi:MAG TPA: class I SAM-dependent methyltransferase [Bdellovibrionota bacterium]|nr:class I SAM-dependent methyltransferase [Bdellovibrionota bacterium]
MPAEVFHHAGLGLEVERLEACPACGSSDSRRAFEKLGTAYQDCAGCGARFANPRPTRAAMLARVESWGGRYADDPATLAAKVASRAGQVELVRRFRKRGRLIDLGTGDGAFVKAARDAGFEAVGYEKSAAACEFARRAYGVEVVQGDLNADRFAEGKFDVVTLWDVIEHLHDPGKVIGVARELLAPGGLLVVFTPNPRGVSARLFGSGWWAFGPKDHICLFSRQALRALFARAGLEPLAIEARGLIELHDGSPHGLGSRALGKLWRTTGSLFPVDRALAAARAGDWVLGVATAS